MILFSALLIVLGLISAFVGFKLFRILLPIIGLIAGIVVGFTGVQATFGSGFFSTTVAVIMAIIVGLIMALLSFFFIELALKILSIVIWASVFTFFGTVIGLQDAGFIMFLLGLAGGIIGLLVASMGNLTTGFVVILTSLVGSAYVFAGIMLLVGGTSIDQLTNTGVTKTIIETVDQSIIWLFAWLGASMFAASVQSANLRKEFFGDTFEYTQVTKTTKV